MKRRLFRELLIASIAIPILYAVAYYAMLDPSTSYIVPGYYSGASLSRSPAYRWNTPIVKKAFEPMHRIDRLVRPDFWFDGNTGPSIEEDPYVCEEDPYKCSSASDD